MVLFPFTTVHSIVVLHLAPYRMGHRAKRAEHEADQKSRCSVDSKECVELYGMYAMHSIFLRLQGRFVILSQIRILLAGSWVIFTTTLILLHQNH
jgi:hypothetical protein